MRSGPRRGGRTVASREQRRRRRPKSWSAVVTATMGRGAGVDGLDHLGVVDALEVIEDAELAVAERALDDDERHALVGQLDGVAWPS